MSTYNEQVGSSEYKLIIDSCQRFLVTNRGPGAVQYVFSDTFPAPGTKGHVLQNGQSIPKPYFPGKLYVSALTSDAKIAISCPDNPEPMSDADAYAYGNRYYSETVSPSVSAGNTFEIYWTSGDYPVHVEFIRTRKPDGIYKIDFYENSVISSASTFTPTNLNRQSTRVIGGEYGVVNTVSNDGNLMFTITHNEAVDRSGVVGEWTQTLLIKPSTTYMLRYTNTSVAAVTFAVTYIMQELRL